jgi:hypothetical protein
MSMSGGISRTQAEPINEDCLSVGVLFRSFPVGKVKKTLKAIDKASIRNRALPNYVVFYYVLMLALFMSDSYREVMRKLVEGFRDARRSQDGIRIVGKSGISQARGRLGHEPFKLVYEECVSQIATKKTKGAWYKDWLLVSFDGSSLDVADSLENEQEFGRHEGDKGSSAYPKIRLVALIENGTRVLFGAAMGAYGGVNATSEMDLAWRVINHLKAGMLCLADRYYLGYSFWKAAAETGADLLWRAKSRNIFEVQKLLPDGSYLSKMYPTPYDRKIDRDGTIVRVIEYKLKWQRDGEVYRLITTILDHEKASADDLAAVYHERWEIETALGEIKTQMRGSNIVLRSKTPELVKQEVYAFLLSYFAVRGLMHEAALFADEDPDRLSFLHTIKVIRRKIPAFGIFPPASLV